MAIPLVCQASLQLRLPQNSPPDIAFSGTVNSAGDFTANLSLITLKLANIDLKLQNVTLTNSGLTVASGTLQLPAKLGGVSGTVNNVTINDSGLSVGGGSVNIPIPNFTFGKGSAKFGVTNATAKLNVTNNGNSYQVEINGTVAIAVRGQNASATGTIKIDDAGNLSGSVSAFNLSVAGLTLSASDIAVNNDGLSIGSAKLKTPAGFGSAEASVSNVSIADGEVSIGGGSFRLPDIKAGNFQLKNLNGSFKTVGNGYEISAAGEAAFPSVGSTGCSGVGVNVTLSVNAQGQTVLVLDNPDQTNGLALKNASLSFKCKIPIGSTGFSITGISGSVTLSDTSTQISIGLTVETNARFSNMALLSANATATLNTSPFDLALNGSLAVLKWRLLTGNVDVQARKVTANVTIQLIEGNRGDTGAKGSANFALWEDNNNNINAAGSVGLQVDIHDGHFSQSYWHPNVPNFDIHATVSADFGKFNNNKWGLKLNTIHGYMILVLLCSLMGSGTSTAWTTIGCSNHPP